MTKMTKDEREAFLAGVHVGVVSVAEPGRGPIAVPVWYDYAPGGDAWFVTGRDSRKGRLLAGAERVTLLAQEEAPPYKYVMVEGPFTTEACDVERHLRPMARRYLGERGGDAYIERTGGAEARDDSIVVRIRPERWLTVDYGK